MEETQNSRMTLPFNVSDQQIIDQADTSVTAIVEEPLSQTLIEEPQVEFTVFEEGSKRGKPLLVASDGYRYYAKKRGKNSVLWFCSSRSVTCKCYASVVQKGSDFVRGNNSHQHGPEPSLKDRVSVSVKVRKEAREQPFKSTIEIEISPS
ncbi:uncharacterized protein LOC132729982 [Ruditapes philippinarum]|uniref:uncharacterized protein LOC132729982 n=1 Tax=Ruditapes philippinarum TaxID=129788 RepID=UPI00295B91CA|nr:uncharacterized protein LOC132729982 [Ruditapes philippinarum]